MASEMSSVSANLRTALISDFKDFFRRPGIAGLEEIDKIYTQDVEFVDPVHAVYGRLALKNYLRGLYEDTREMSFEYLDEQIGDNSASISWRMHFRHRRIKGGKPLELKGVTLIRFTDRVYYHEDFYDLGAMLYQHLPVLGFFIRLINKRLAA